MDGAGRNPSRIEFDVGDVQDVFGLDAYHAGRNTYFPQQYFFGFFGPGQIPLWSTDEVTTKIELIFRFYSVFLPEFAARS